MNELKYWINDMDEWIFHTLEEDFSMQTNWERILHTDNTKMKNIYTERQRFTEKGGEYRERIGDWKGKYDMGENF